MGNKYYQSCDVTLKLSYYVDCRQRCIHTYQPQHKSYRKEQGSPEWSFSGQLKWNKIVTALDKKEWPNSKQRMIRRKYIRWHDETNEARVN